MVGLRFGEGNTSGGLNVEGSVILPIKVLCLLRRV
jgi:hypothetical protein